MSKIEHRLYYDKLLKQPWAVHWWPEGREGRGSRQCEVLSRGFATPTLRGEFVRNGFEEDPLVARASGKGRKRAGQDREQREEPENWPDELSEVMARVAEIRANSGKPYSLPSDVYAAMKDLGFERPGRRVQQDWPDELTEVMGRVAQIRATSGRTYPLLSDWYAAAIQLGLERPGRRVQHHADVHAST